MLKAIVNSPVRSGNQTIVSGDLVIGTAGNGIDFSANANAPGMTSELLDWYEEGTWTPTVTAFSGTITTVGAVSGTYTRIGRFVAINYSVAITNNGTGAVAIVLSSVPFTPAKNSFGMGKETQATGNANICFVNAGAAEIFVQTFTATYPANNNTTLEGQITFTV